MAIMLRSGYCYYVRVFCGFVSQIWNDLKSIKFWWKFCIIVYANMLSQLVQPITTFNWNIVENCIYVVYFEVAA
jgi:hypothetical protein